MESAEVAIQRLRREHLQAVNSCDVDLLLRGMSDDIVYLGPGAGPVVGKEALRSMIAPVYAQASIQIEAVPLAVEINGSMAVEWGEIRGEMKQGPDLDSSAVALKYLFVYQLESDGEWRISHDIYNDGPHE